MNKLKIIAGLVLMCFFSLGLSAQSKYFTREANINFVSDAPIEKIEATNNKVSSAIDPVSGKIEFIALVKSFHFEKALMQEHFNENYMESDKYPKSTFTGTITNLKDINWSKDGTYKANVKGKLTIHGVTKDVSTVGTITVKGQNISVKSGLKVVVADYNISIPSLVKDKIAKIVDLDIFGDYKPI